MKKWRCLLISFVLLLLFSVPAYAVTTSYSILFNQTKTLYLSETGSVSSATWRSSDGRIVEIVDSGRISCTIRAVDNTYGNKARITCTYNLLVGGTVLRKYEYYDITIPKKDSGGSDTPTGNYPFALQTESNHVYLDLASNSGEGTVVYTLKPLKNAQEPNTWRIIPKGSVSSIITFKYSQSMNGVYYLPLTGVKKGSTTLTLQATPSGLSSVLAEAVLYVTVDCSHQYDAGKMVQKSADSSVWCRKYTCKFCGHTQTVPVVTIGDLNWDASDGSLDADITVTESAAGAQAFCAAYRNGQLVSLSAAELTADNSNRLSFRVNEKELSSVKLFILDEKYAALCPAIPVI